MVDHVKRQLRRDFSSIDERTARALIDEFDGLVRRLVGYYLARHRGFYALTFDDLLAVGHGAVLEAYVTYRPGDVSKERQPGRFGGGLYAHVRRTVCWRCGDYVTRLGDELPVARFVAGDGGPTAGAEAGVERTIASSSPEEAAMQQELRAWVQGALAELPPRQRALVCALARGEPMTQVARRLGIGRTRAYAEKARAMAHLRHLAGEALDDASVGE